MQHEKNDLIQENGDPKTNINTAESWLEFAQTQNLISELLQFELDGLSDVIEEKVKNIEDVFYSLSSITKSKSKDDIEHDEISRNLETIVKNLQFQDLVSQKIENISNSLKTLQSYSKEVISREDRNGDVNLSNLLSNSSYIERIIKERTLEEMRSSMLNNLESISKVDYELISSKLTTTISKRCIDEGCSDNVELF